MVLDNSKSTLESQSQNHSQKCRILSPKTLTYGVFCCDFGFDSHEWSCSKGRTSQAILVEVQLHEKGERVEDPDGQVDESIVPHTESFHQGVLCKESCNIGRLVSVDRAWSIHGKHGRGSADEPFGRMERLLFDKSMASTFGTLSKAFAARGRIKRQTDALIKRKAHETRGKNTVNSKRTQVPVMDSRPTFTATMSVDPGRRGTDVRVEFLQTMLNVPLQAQTSHASSVRNTEVQNISQEGIRGPADPQPGQPSLKTVSGFDLGPREPEP